MGEPGGVQHARARLYATDVEQSEATRTQGSAQGFTPVLAEDALLLLPGQYALQGRAAITAALVARPLETATGTLWWEPLRWDVSADGQLGYSTGRVWRDTRRPDGSVWRYHGAYVSTWKRGVDGSWQLAASVRSNLAPPTSPVPPLPDLPQGCRPFHDNGRHGAKDGGDAEAFLAEAFATDTAFAAEAAAQGSAQAFYDYASEQVYVRGTCGRAALVPDPSEPGGTLEWAPALGGAAGSGDLAWTVGPYSIPVPGENGETLRFYGKYLSVWAREQDGSLRYLVDMGAGSPGGERL